MPKLVLASISLALALFVAAPARATLIGDTVGAELVTENDIADFSPATAVVGAGVEFAVTFNPLIDPDPFLEVDVHDGWFEITYTNPATTGCPGAGTCAYNAGLEAIVLSDLDWLGAPGSQVVGVVPIASTFPVGEITGVSFGPDHVRVEFDTPAIPGFGTVWSASWTIVHAVPEPALLPMLASLFAVLRLRRPGA